MSGESTDSESQPSNNNNRSRSLLRQVRAKLISRSCSRHRIETIDESLSFSLLREKRQSCDNMAKQNRCRKKPSRTTAPVSYSHNLSLFNQVKSHFIGARKPRQIELSILNNDDDDDY